MEEQRQRQEDEQRRAIAESDVPAGGALAAAAVTAGVTATASAAAGSSVAATVDEPNTEEAMLQRALALSTETPVKRNRVRASVFFFIFYSFVLSKFAFFSSNYFVCNVCMLII